MLKVDYFSIIHKYIKPDSEFYRIYLPHVTLVTNKALQIARCLGLSPDRLQFIEEASMLHDIGVSQVKSSKWESDGILPYICHGDEGKKILEAEGLPKHALVAERHIGVGITLEEIEKKDLPLPHHDASPQTQEERIISYADNFFSKRPEKIWQEDSFEEILDELSEFGQDQVEIFKEWHAEFS